MTRVRRFLWEWLPALVVFVAGIVIWEGAVRGLDVQNFLLPAPSAIVQTLWSDREELWSAAFFTSTIEPAGGRPQPSTARVLITLD